MTEQNVVALTKDLIKKHLNHGWTVRISRAKSYLGQCSINLYTGKKEITVAKRLFTDYTEEEVTNVILHEIAHALDHERNGRRNNAFPSSHGHGWKRICIEIGARPERLMKEQPVVIRPKEETHKYTLTCPACGKKYYMHRLSSNSSKSCGKCSKYYDPKYALVVTTNY